jgi:hypothetical protein
MAVGGLFDNVRASGAQIFIRNEFKRFSKLPEIIPFSGD